MLILKYFLVVGAVLTLGLIALNAHLLPDGSKPPAAVIHSATTASLPTVAPNVPPPPEPETGAELLDELDSLLTDYVVFPSAKAADAVTLWIGATHG